MLLHPHVQRKAQEEIDKIIAQGRIPDLTDYEALPYLEAVLFETMRWEITLPFWSMVY